MSADAGATDRVRLRIAEHVATVTLNRPGKHNALDLEMFDAIIATIARVGTESGVRAVVLHGEGPSFCSGIDLGALMAAMDGPDGVAARLLEPPPTFFQRVSYDWGRLQVPVIAAIHGTCYGGGLQVALGADIRIAAPGAKLSIMEIRLGLIPDMGITRTLPHLVGLDRAKELTFTGRIVSGEEAARLGLVTRLAEDPLAAARELATELAGRSPDAIRAVKRLYDEAWRSPVERALALEAELQRALIGTPNQLAAVAAALTKQPAAFIDPI